MHLAEAALVEVAKYLDRVEWHGPDRAFEHDKVWPAVEIVQAIAFVIPEYYSKLRPLKCLRSFRFQFRRGEFRQLGRDGLYEGNWVEDEEELWEHVERESKVDEAEFQEWVKWAKTMWAAREQDA
eukprot:SAG11_NODE_12777_length_685_cov_3.075085_1_plen_125_part_00